MASLNFDWDLVTHSKVLAVIGVNERRMNDGSLTWDEIAFVLGKKAVLLSVNIETDEVVVDYLTKPEGEPWRDVSALARFVGLPLGWCWQIANCRGYSDVFSLAFGDVVPDVNEPQITFIGEGSSLACFWMTRLV